MIIPLGASKLGYRLGMSSVEDKLPLTKCQLRVLRILKSNLSQGISPTYEDMAKEYGCVKSNIHKILYKLRSKGWVSFISASKRGIKLL